MLNNEKIRLMTRMASFDEVEGKRDIAVNGYFRGDYICFQVVMSAIYGTIAFAVVVALYLLYNLESFLADFYKMDLMAFAKDWLTRYFIVLLIYLVISYFVYAFRFSRSKRRIRAYQQQLKQLHQIYEEENERRR
ncbi:MAG: hypothetical protein K6D90_09910 [Lachnospiraceae bacterium]|nr:hypothetical protein [Lachnospiraceae bacterium]